MAQLIATNQLTLTNVNDGAQGTPGPKGVDGKTSYHHWAYSDNADGTGLTLTDNGQRYMGYYTDYTQADSTDKTKYTWADRWAKIEVGGRNYIRDFGFANNPNFNNHTSLWKYERIADSTARSGYHIKATCTKSGSNGFHRVLRDLRGTEWQGRTMTYSIDIKASKSVRMRLGAEAFNKGYKAFDVTTKWQRFVSTDVVNFKTLYSFPFYAEAITWTVGDVVYIRDPQLEDGTVATTPRGADEDVNDLIDTKADQDKVVYKTDISVTDEGIVHSASKTVNGQTIASMIAQRAEWVEIIANLLKVKGDMIVDGTIGANKLSVSTLSALAADLGQISGGSLELLESVAQVTAVDAWGNFTIPAHKWGLYIDNRGTISSGTPVRKSSSESVASDMPIAVLASGEIRFARVDQNNDLRSILHYGLSDADNASIGFNVASDGTKQLFIQANGQIVNQGTNYTGWISTGVSGVNYKRQGDVVALKLQLNTTANQEYRLGRIPAELIPIPNSGTMMRVTAWTADQSFGRNLQINVDGTMDLLSSGRADTFNTQVTWII